MGSPPKFQGPARLCHPAGMHACVPPTLVVFHPSVRLWLVRRRGSIATPPQIRASTPCGNGGIPYAPANRRFDSGRSGGLRGRYGFRPGPNLRCGRCVPVSHQTTGESSAGAHGLLLHLSPRTPPTDLSAHRAGRIEWRDATWVHHLEVGETAGRELDGSIACPHTKGVPFATRIRPSQLVLRASQPEWSPL